MRTRERIPVHLRRFVVEQDYATYDAVDQAVWRFVLLQTHARLRDTAHPAYTEGLARTGISVERIPRIDEMDARLGEFGWGAVAVDGFIPPRAFQEFQALGIMTIAAGIRRVEHLAYTPAPDIIHESAGHSPIVPDPVYRGYLQRFGTIGARAFSSPADRSLAATIHELSELKERAEANPAEVSRLEAELREAEAGVGSLSEVARLSRLHWWTVEYGLVGTPRDYRIYGAGLLSSLGESHFCHAPRVSKRRLDASCIEVDYDITRPQPQLFVAESFDHLDSVLDEVAADLAFRRGGLLALERARDSAEVATLELDSGLQLMGRLEEVLSHDGDPIYLRLAGPCALGRDGRTLTGHDRSVHAEGYGTPVGRLEDGSALSALAASDLARFSDATAPDSLELRYRSGVVVRGRPAGWLAGDDGRLRLLSLDACSVRYGERVLFGPEWGRYDLGVGEAVVSAAAGPADPAYWPETEFPSSRPRTRESGRSDGRLRELYRDAVRVWDRAEPESLSEGLEPVARELREAFPDAWLLRWNLVECLRKVDRGIELEQRLRQELLAIETRFPADLPITTGLEYLDRVYPTGSDPD